MKSRIFVPLIFELHCCLHTSYSSVKAATMFNICRSLKMQIAGHMNLTAQESMSKDFIVKMRT